MVISCWVYGCTNKFTKSPNTNSTQKLKFFAFPKIREHEGSFTKSLTEDRRRLWIDNINRNTEPTKHSRVCSDHFITGSPAYMYERNNPDWAPTLKLGHVRTLTKSQKKQAEVESNQTRFRRLIKRQETKKKRHVKALRQQDSISPEKSEPSNSSIQHVTESQINCKFQRLSSENMKLQAEIDTSKLTKESFKDNDEQVNYYTGLPNYKRLMLLLNIVSPFLSSDDKCIGAFERLLMTLMRLKLNFPMKDLAYRFNISTSTVSRIILDVIHILYVRLESLIYWPEREELQKTMPVEFQTYFSTKTAVIIDCFEICFQRPKGLMARAQTWSQYKQHSTVKYLLGITLQGSISFISSSWGGQASNKFITEECGILNKLLPGDLVLADRDFDISDNIGLYCAEINIQTSTPGKPQLSATDYKTTRIIAHVGNHVEKVIGLVRNKYMILKDMLPADYLMSEECGVPVIDKITTVCCALTNIYESVVGFD